MPTLSQMSWSYVTDKGVRGHAYTRFYDEAFAPFRHEPITLLEIGVAVGGSLMLWDEYFDHPATQIVGVDDHPFRTHYSGRIELVLENVTSWDPTGREFDIVVDDGSHLYREVRPTFAKLWPLVRPGGLYVVEDLHCMSQDHQDRFLDELVEGLEQPVQARCYEGETAPGGKHPGLLAVFQKNAT